MNLVLRLADTALDPIEPSALGKKLSDAATAD